MRFLIGLFLLLSSLSALAVVGAGARRTPIRIAKIKDLHPTQFIYAERYVDVKAKELDSMSKKDLNAYLRADPIPVVIGPGGVLYMIDHHHQASALSKIGKHKAFITVLYDWHDMNEDAFWKKMVQNDFAYLYDENDELRSPSELPEHVDQLANDDYRALAVFARKRGAYEKTDTPYAECKWGRFFRKYISKKDLKNDWDKAVDTAVRLAHRSSAVDMPGYKGPTCSDIFAPK